MRTDGAESSSFREISSPRNRATGRMPPPITRRKRCRSSSKCTASWLVLNATVSASAVNVMEGEGVPPPRALTPRAAAQLIGGIVGSREGKQSGCGSRRQDSEDGEDRRQAADRRSQQYECQRGGECRCRGGDCQGCGARHDSTPEGEREQSCSPEENDQRQADADGACSPAANRRLIRRPEEGYEETDGDQSPGGEKEVLAPDRPMVVFVIPPGDGPRLNRATQGSPR
jgi:hypothetical protein